MCCLPDRAQGLKDSRTFYPTAELLSRSHMVLGSFPGGHELRINTSENISPKPKLLSLSKHLLPRILAQVLITSSQKWSTEGCAKYHVSCEKHFSVFLKPWQTGACNCPEILFWSQTSLSLHQESLHTLAVKCWTTKVAQVSVTRARKQMLQGWHCFDSLDNSILIKCPLWTRASEETNVKLIMTKKSATKQAIYIPSGQCASPSATPYPYSRAMSQRWQPGIARWLPNYFLSHIFQNRLNTLLNSAIHSFPLILFMILFVSVQ